MAAKPTRVELVHTLQPEYNVSETNGTGVFVDLVGPLSKQFQAAKEVYETTEGTQEDNIRLMSSCIVGWDNEDFDGMECTPENVFAVLSNPENSWIATFLAPVIQDHKNFFPVS